MSFTIIAPAGDNSSRNPIIKELERTISILAAKIEEAVEKTDAENKFYSIALDKAVDATLKSGESPAQILSKAEKLEKAGNLSEALVKYLKYRRVSLVGLQGKDAEDVGTADMYQQVGLAHLKQSLYSDALKFFEKELDLRRQLLPAGHASLGATFKGIAEVNRKTGNTAEALVYYGKSLAIGIAHVGEVHLDIATIYKGMGDVHYRQGDNDTALAYYDKALKIGGKLGGSSTDIVRSCNGFAVVCRRKGKYDDALAYYFQALKIKMKMLGDDHPELASNYNNIGIVYKKQGKLFDAQVYFEKALAILKLKKLGDDHKDVKAVLSRIQACKLPIDFSSDDPFGLKIPVYSASTTTSTSSSAAPLPAALSEGGHIASFGSQSSFSSETDVPICEP